MTAKKRPEDRARKFTICLPKELEAHALKLQSEHQFSAVCQAAIRASMVSEKA